MTCKANCAACVKANTPQLTGIETANVVILSKQRIDRYNTRFIDMSHKRGIISKTIGMPILGDCGAREERQQASEDPYPPRRGDVEPGAREGSRSEISRQRVLRPARCRATGSNLIRGLRTKINLPSRWILTLQVVRGPGRP
jgi:hypothetical protein